MQQTIQKIGLIAGVIHGPLPTLKSMLVITQRSGLKIGIRHIQQFIQRIMSKIIKVNGLPHTIKFG